MASTKDTVWKLEPHTRAKHEILKRYLQAWVPILSLGRFPKVLYVDGFAGPGIYSGGEPGSPIIALRAGHDQRVPITAQIRFLFIEKVADRAEMLEKQIAAEAPTFPTNFRVQVLNDTFEAAFGRVLESYKEQGQRLPPTFAFIDPFGWDVPFAMVAEIMSYRSCEVLVTFMYEEINRFIGLPDQERNFDKFFGCADWRDGITLIGPEKRNRFLHDLYMRQLHTEAKVMYVRSFKMQNERDVIDYYLFYGTNNLLGLEKMKDAVWKIDVTGEFRFSDATDPNQMIFFSEPRFDLLRREVANRFGGTEATVGDIERFVIGETAFRKAHYKRHVLKPMEQAGEIEPVNPRPGRQPGTYADRSLRLRFK